MNYKTFKLRVKALEEEGTFEGFLSTYGNVDEVGDIVEPGAFAKTLLDAGGVVPMLWGHNQNEPIGTLELTDTPEGLKAKGRFALDVQRAREVYALVKMNAVRGLSIGYQTVKDKLEGGIRRLKEIKLYEGSVVTFPANMRATIEAVKAAREGKEDFNTCLAECQLWAARYQMFNAITDSLDDIAYDASLGAEDKVNQSRASIRQFEEAYTGMLPDYLALMAPDSGGAMEMMSRRAELEAKQGRVLSEANRQKVQQCIDDLSALLEAAATAEGAAKSQQEPDSHSSLMLFKSQILEGISCPI